MRETRSLVSQKVTGPPCLVSVVIPPEQTTAPCAAIGQSTPPSRKRALTASAGVPIATPKALARAESSLRTTPLDKVASTPKRIARACTVAIAGRNCNRRSRALAAETHGFWPQFVEFQTSVVESYQMVVGRCLQIPR